MDQETDSLNDGTVHSNDAAADPQSEPNGCVPDITQASGKADPIQDEPGIAIPEHALPQHVEADFIVDQKISVASVAALAIKVETPVQPTAEEYAQYQTDKKMIDLVASELDEDKRDLKLLIAERNQCCRLLPPKEGNRYYGKICVRSSSIVLMGAASFLNLFNYATMHIDSAVMASSFAITFLGLAAAGDVAITECSNRIKAFASNLSKILLFVCGGAYVVGAVTKFAAAAVAQGTPGAPRVNLLSLLIPVDDKFLLGTQLATELLAITVLSISLDRIFELRRFPTSNSRHFLLDNWVSEKSKGIRQKEESKIEREGRCTIFDVKQKRYNAFCRLVNTASSK